MNSAQELLRREFDAEEGTFLLKLRIELKWDKSLFARLTSLMFSVAEEMKGAEVIPVWVANGFWFCDTWVKEWSSHPTFPRPDEGYYKISCETLHDLAYMLFTGESPYADETLRNRCEPS